MQFFLDRSDSVPPQTQLRDQIKFAIAVGRLRPGDTLPSVRDVEKDLGIGKNVTWRVYQQLQKAGLISLRQGKGACVVDTFPGRVDKDKLEICGQLCEQILVRAMSAGIHPASLVRQLQQHVVSILSGWPPLIFAECNRTETEVFNQQIGDAWNVDVRGVVFEDLRTTILLNKRALAWEAGRTKSVPKTVVLTSTFHVDEVCDILKGIPVEVIGLSFHWDRRMLKMIKAVAESGRILFVSADRDRHRYAQVFMKELHSILGKSRLKVEMKGLSEVRDLDALCSSRDYNLIIFSNRIWHQIPPDVRRLPFVVRPTLEIDPRSLEQARTRAGVIW